MAVISIIGHKGGVGKTTLSINIAAAITKALHSTENRKTGLFVRSRLKVTNYYRHPK